jgi:hypothetical protein
MLNMTFDPILMSIVGFFLLMLIGGGVYLYKRKYGKGLQRYVREMKNLENKGVVHAGGTSFELASSKRRIRITPSSGTTRDQWIILIDSMPKGVELTIYCDSAAVNSGKKASELETADPAFNKVFQSDKPQWASDLFREDNIRKSMMKFRDKFKLQTLIFRDIGSHGAVVVEVKREGMDSADAVALLGAANSISTTLQTAMRMF